MGMRRPQAWPWLVYYTQVWVQRSCCCAKAHLRQSPKALLWRKLWSDGNAFDTHRTAPADLFLWRHFHLVQCIFLGPILLPLLPDSLLWFPCPFWCFRVFLHWEKEGAHSWEKFSHLWTLFLPLLRKRFLVPVKSLWWDWRNGHAFKGLFRQRESSYKLASFCSVYP